MRRLLVAFLLLLAPPAAADMYQNAGNAKLPEARYNIGSSDACNPVSDFGADPTGVADAAPAINQCSALTRNGERINVFLPTGTYLVKAPITVDAQCLFGSSRQNTTIVIDNTFSTTGAGVVLLSGREQKAGCIHDLTFKFTQPADISTTASAGAATGATSIQVASAAGVVVGDYVHNRVLGNSSIRWASTVTSIAGTTIGLSHSVGSSPVVTGNEIVFAAPRSDYKTLAEGCTNTSGGAGTGCKYPPAIKVVTANRFQLYDLNFYGAWQGVDAGTVTGGIGGLDIHDIDMGAFDYGIFLDNARDAVRISDIHCWNFGMNLGQAIGVYMDGTPSCLKLGRVDGLVASNIVSWQANISTVPNGGASIDDWHFSSIVVDGGSIYIDNTLAAHFANLSMVETNGEVGRPMVRIGSGAGGGANRVFISNSSIGNNNDTEPAILQNGGTLWLTNSFVSNISAAPGSGGAAKVTGGGMVIRGSTIYNPNATNTTAPLVSNTGAGVLHLTSNSFGYVPVGQAPVAILVTDNVGNYISDNRFAGTKPVLPFLPGPILGYYDFGEYEFVFSQAAPASGPVFVSFATPGNSVLTVAALGGGYRLRGEELTGSLDLVFDNNAYTTASGRFQVSIPSMPPPVGGAGCTTGTVDSFTTPTMPMCNITNTIAPGAGFYFDRLVSGGPRTIVGTAEVLPSKHMGLRISWRYAYRAP